MEPIASPDDLVATLLSRRAKRATSSVIRDLLQHANRPDVISLAGGIPAPELFPLEQLADSAATALAELGSDAVQYGLTEGVLELRELIAVEADLVTAGASTTSPDQVLVTTGSQQAIDLLGRVLLDPGDVVVTDDPAYLGALQALRGHDPELVGIAIDEHGLVTDDLAERLATGLRPTLVYTNPNFQNPTGVTMSLGRRRHLAELADQYGFLIIEDDPYGALRFSGEAVPTMASFTDRVVRIATVSKTLAPGLRVAWLIGPQALIDSVTIAKQAVDLHTSTLTQHTALGLLRQPGWFRDHQATLGPWYRDRRDALAAGLHRSFGDQLRFDLPEGGMFLWAELLDHDDLDTTELLDAALDHGVAFVPGSAFAVATPLPRHLRLSFATASPEQLGDAAGRLAAAASSLG